MFDDRVDCAVLVTEKALLRRNKRVKVLRRTELSKRWASDILADFGPKDCPTGMVISPELFREAREALGWSQAEAAWKLGYERRSGPTIRNLEQGVSTLRRFARILTMQALEQLAVKQKKIFSSARVHGMRERDGQ